MSRKPRVQSRPTTAPVRVRIEFRPTVVPCRKYADDSSSSPVSSSEVAVSTPSSGAAGVVGTLPTRISPLAS